MDEVNMNSKSKKLVSVIIVTYNNLEVVKDCIKSIYQYNDIGDGLEIIVVDNSPNNFVVNYIEMNHPNVIIVNNENTGFGDANNIGFQISESDYILLLNPDTILVEPIFKFAISKFESDIKLGLFGVKLIDLSGDTNQSFNFIDHYGLIPAQIIKLCHKISCFVDGKMYIQGADMFIRRTAFIEAGLFDSRMFMYYEEPDLIKRIKEKNYKTAYFKNKKIIHLEGKSSGTSVNMLKIKLQSQKIYCDKYGIDFYREIKHEIFRMKVKSLYYYFVNTTKYKDYSIKIAEMKRLLNNM